MPEGIISALEIQKRNKQRVNVYLDGEYAFSLALDEAARLRKGDFLSAAQVEALRTEDEVLRAVESAARFLSYRPRSIHEVRKNLREKDVPPPVIDAAMLRLEKLGYLDDAAFAAFWVRERSNFKPLSPQALRYELRQKGVPDAIIAEVLAQVDVEEAVLNAAQSQLRRLRGSTRRTFRERLSAFLQRRGFAYRDIRAALRRIEEDLENDTAFFALDGDEEHSRTPTDLDE